MRIARSLLLLVVAMGCSSNDPPGGGTTPGADGGPSGGGSSGPAWIGLKGDRMAALPQQQPGETDHFGTAERCAQCHAANDQSTALRDAKGRDVSPANLWRASMMANAARDPFYLAEFSHESSLHTGATATVEKTCSRCHAPEASVEQAIAGARLTFADMTTAVTPLGQVAREGIACTLCHQIMPDNLGDVSSFTGGFVTGDARAIFGPHQNPSPGPMQTFVSYTPTYATHVTESKLCATCHTVITRAIDAKGNPVGLEFAEQVPYLEWQNSAYNTEGTPGPKAASCQGCHMPVNDEDGAGINTVLATYKNIPLSPRNPIGRHLMLGGNGYMLRVFADNTQWMGTASASADLAAQAQRTDDFVRRAVTLAIKSSARAGGGLEVVVSVGNQSGHKFPTGYPSRRAWLHVTLSQGGNVFFDSGAFDEFGRLVDRKKNVLDHFGTVLPHKDVVDAETQVQVYESVPGDQSEKVPASLLDAFRYIKDNRLMPIGFDKKHKNMLYTPWVGINGDPNFGSEDQVTYRVANAPAGAVHVKIELLFQAVKPADIEGLAAKPNPASLKFFDMITAKPPLPVVLATAEADAQ